jgi:hypothetical protein
LRHGIATLTRITKLAAERRRQPQPLPEQALLLFLNWEQWQTRALARVVNEPQNTNLANTILPPVNDDCSHGNEGGIVACQKTEFLHPLNGLLFPRWCVLDPSD